VGHFDTCPEKIIFHIISDTLWLTSNNENIQTERKYLRAKSKHYFSDIKNYIGIELNLPLGSSNKIDNNYCYSIYLPKQITNNSEYKIILNNERLPLDSLLHEKLFDLRKDNGLAQLNTYALYIDSETKYNTVKLLKTELRKAGFYRIAYICDPSKEKYYQSLIGIKRKLLPIFEKEKYYINPSVRKFLDSTKLPTPPKEFFEKPDFKKPNVCKVEIIENEVFLNDSIFDSTKFYEKLQNNNSLLTYLYIDNESDYQTYINFISEYDSLNQKIRNKKSIELYQTEYNKLIDNEKIKNIGHLTINRLIEK
jgi:biopolymer transport protein ExbD